MADPAQNIWWNREKVIVALSLSKEQRQQMDQQLTDHLVARRERIAKLRTIRQAYVDELKKRDWEAARQSSAAVAETMAAISQGESNLTIEVLRQLEPEQLAKLNSEFPYILQRQWVRSGLRLQGAAGRRAMGGTQNPAAGVRDPGRQ